MSDFSTPEDRVRSSGGKTEALAPSVMDGPDDDTGWPEPIDFLGITEMTGVPELRADHLPAAIAPFVFDTARRMGADPACVALAAIVSLASVASDDWGQRPRRQDHTWIEKPRLWGAIVGDPSSMKSPIIHACSAPVDALDAAARASHAQANREYKIRYREWKEAGSDHSTTPLAPKLARYLVESATTEALSEVLRTDDDATQRAPAGKVLARHDEMSELVAGFDRYRQGGRGGADRGAYLRLYNGGRHTIDRVGRGNFAIENWSACLLGGIQPEPIQRIAREASDDGLLQRFLYAVPERSREGEDCRPNLAALSRYQSLFPALSALRPAYQQREGVHGPYEEAMHVTFHAAAHQHRESIDELVRVLSAMPHLSTRVISALGKWPGTFARLALTFHLIEVADARARNIQPPFLYVVSPETARRVETYMREILLPHLLRADAVMFSTTQTTHAKWIAGYILSEERRTISGRSLHHAYGALRAPEHKRELQSVMDSLVAVEWLEPIEPKNSARDVSSWKVNPKIYSVFKDRAVQERARRAAARESIAQALAKGVLTGNL